MPESSLSDDLLLSDVPVHEGYKVLGGVVLYQKLGQGGMGAVYRGKHLRLEVDVALKVMATPAGLHPDHAANYLQRFLREAKTAASVKHQNLIRVYDVNSEHGVHFLIMDFVDGESAGDRLKRRGVTGVSRLTEQEAVEISLGAAEGLAAAHRRGIVHRDVKPDNILVDKEGNVVVADLGLAKAYGADDSDSALSMGLSLTQQAMGTPYYMAPEQTRSARDVGPQADVWSLGVTLYQLVSGKLPWNRTDLVELIGCIRQEPTPDPKTHCSELSEGLCAIIDRALQKEPADRYADCSEIAKALRAHLDTIKQSGESALPDEGAGKTKMVVVTLTPPPSRTLTLIGKTLLRPSDSERLTAQAPAGTGATAPAEAPALGRGGLPGWVLPSALGGAAALIVLIVALTWALSRGPSPAPVAPVVQTQPDTLEAEAAAFYEAQLEGIAAERFEEVLAAIDGTESKYEKTTYGVRISKLRERAAAKVAEMQAREEEARKQAAFEAAVAAADDAEKAGNLEEAARQLQLALEQRDDPAVGGRLAEIERRMKLGRLLAEAAGHVKAEEWERAKAKYKEALEFADDKSRDTIRATLAEMEHRIEVEKVVAAIRREANAREWRKAWGLVEDARAKRIDDPRLAELALRIAAKLAPPRSLTGPLGVELVLVPGGTFKMGSSSGKRTERPVHAVTLSSLYLGRCEVTRAQYEAFRRTLREVEDASSADARTPAISISWDEAVAFCKYLSVLDERETAFRLPTEAEWEFAARGADAREYPWGNGPPTPKHANTEGEEDGFAALAPVGSFTEGATSSGIFDLAGNAAEWCSDWYGRYPAEPQTNPKGPASGKLRALRGGSFLLDTSYLRGAARGGRSPDNPGEFIGFRVVRGLTPDEQEFHALARGRTQGENE